MRIFGRGGLRGTREASDIRSVLFHFVPLPVWQVVERMLFSKPCGYAPSPWSSPRGRGERKTRGPSIYMGCLGGVWFEEMSNGKGLCAIHNPAILLWITFVDNFVGAEAGGRSGCPYSPRRNDGGRWIRRGREMVGAMGRVSLTSGDGCRHRSGRPLHHM